MLAEGNVPNFSNTPESSGSSGSVTWRDVTLRHSISGSPVLQPGTTGTTSRVVSEQSPGSPAISSYL
eukprot:1326635-Amorphochlora_amoeboformis.AAC.1